MRMKTKNDKAWYELFIDRDLVKEIETNNKAIVTANEMKKYREPRLMAKIDTSDVLPSVFKEQKLSILPIKNGEYLLFRDPKKQSFFKFPDNINDLEINHHEPAIPLSFFDSFGNFESLNESQALDVALMSSILKEFTGENNLWLTIRGRQFTKEFQVFIPSIKQNIAISQVQIEIDAGYESENAIYIFEAKIGKRENFNIRQLLFPYLEWKTRTEKPIIPIFFYYTNGFHYLFQFDLGNSLDASRIVKKSCFTISKIERFDLYSIISTSTLNNQLVKGVPFPQANDLDKVIDTVSLINQGYKTKEELSDIFEFDERQGDYYGNAARYLGFINKNNDYFTITKDGESLLKQNSPAERAYLITRQLAQRPVFHQIFNSLLKHNLNFEHLTEINIPELIHAFSEIEMETSRRRASTVRQWIKWIHRYAK